MKSILLMSFLVLSFSSFASVCHTSISKDLEDGSIVLLLEDKDEPFDAHLSLFLEELGATNAENKNCEDLMKSMKKELKLDLTLGYGEVFPVKVKLIK